MGDQPANNGDKPENISRLAQQAHAGQRSVRLIAVSISLIVAFVVLVSAFAHVSNCYAFLSTIYSYQLVSPWFGIMLAAFLPFTQLAFGLALLFVPRHRRFVFACCIPMFAVFTAVQVVTLIRGLDVSCGCFGSSAAKVGYSTISVAGLCLLLSVIGFLVTSRVPPISNAVERA